MAGKTIVILGGGVGILPGNRLWRFAKVLFEKWWLRHWF